MINQYQDKQYQRGTMSKFNNNKDKPYQRKTMTNTIYKTNMFDLHVNSGRKSPFKSFKKIIRGGFKKKNYKLGLLAQPKVGRCPEGV